MQEERDLQTTERFELRRESENVASMDSQLKGRGFSSPTYGGAIEFQNNNQVQLNGSQQIAERSASTYGKDVTSRAVSKITQKTRTQIARRTVSLFEERGWGKEEESRYYVTLTTCDILRYSAPPSQPCGGLSVVTKPPAPLTDDMTTGQRIFKASARLEMPRRNPDQRDALFDWAKAGVSKTEYWQKVLDGLQELDLLQDNADFGLNVVLRLIYLYGALPAHFPTPWLDADRLQSKKTLRVSPPTQTLMKKYRNLSSSVCLPLSIGTMIVFVPKKSKSSRMRAKLRTKRANRRRRTISMKCNTPLFKKHGISGWWDIPQLSLACVEGTVVYPPAESTDSLATIDLDVTRLEVGRARFSFNNPQGIAHKRYLRVEYRFRMQPFPQASGAYSVPLQGQRVRICGDVKWDSDKEGWYEIHPRGPDDITIL